MRCGSLYPSRAFWFWKSTYYTFANNLQKSNVTKLAEKFLSVVSIPIMVGIGNFGLKTSECYIYLKNELLVINIYFQLKSEDMKIIPLTSVYFC